MPQWTLRCLISLSAAFLTLTTACSSQTVSTNGDDATAPDTSVSETASSDTPVDTSATTLKAYLPGPQGDTVLKNIQESEDEVTAFLVQGKTPIAVLAIRDKSANPGVVNQYRASDKRVNDFPAQVVDQPQTTLLVGDQYEAAIRSLAATFSEEDRKNWLTQFDLEGLAADAGGADLSAYFPKSEADLAVSEAKKNPNNVWIANIKEGDDVVAVITLTDISNSPNRVAGYSKTSEQTVAGYPSLEINRPWTAALVDNRWEASVTSLTPEVTEADREVWLQSFDLQGLQSAQK